MRLCACLPAPLPACPPARLPACPPLPACPLNTHVPRPALLSGEPSSRRLSTSIGRGRSLGGTSRERGKRTRQGWGCAPSPASACTLTPPPLSPCPCCSADEVAIIKGALDMSHKTARTAMTPMDMVFMLPADAPLDEDTLTAILASGHRCALGVHACYVCVRVGAAASGGPLFAQHARVSARTPACVPDLCSPRPPCCPTQPYPCAPPGRPLAGAGHFAGQGAVCVCVWGGGGGPERRMRMGRRRAGRGPAPPCAEPHPLARPR